MRASGAVRGVRSLGAMEPVRAPSDGGAGPIDRDRAGARSAARPAPWLPAPVARRASAVVLLVLDGLGWNALEAHRSRLPVLGAMAGGTRSRRSRRRPPPPRSRRSPPGWPRRSTASSGFRMRVDDDVLNVLRWQLPTASGRPTRSRAAPHRVPRPAGAGRHQGASSARPASPTRTCAVAASSAGSTCRSLVEHCRRLVSAGERFVYAYYPGVDTVAHEFGLTTTFYRAELAAADALVGRAARRAARRRPRWSSPPTTARCTSGRTAGSSSPELEPLVDDAGGRRPVPLPVRATGRGRRAARGRGAMSSATTRGCSPASELLDEGWLGPGAGGVDPAARRRRRARGPGAGRRSSTRRCPTRRPCSRSTGPSPPTRCTCPSSPPGATRRPEPLSRSLPGAGGRSIFGVTPCDSPQGLPQPCGQRAGRRARSVSSSFVHLHLHTEYSMLDGAAADRRRRRARPPPTASPRSASPTTGTCTASSTSTAPRATAGITPVIGTEGYFVTTSRFDRPRRAEHEIFHLTLLAEIERGLPQPHQGVVARVPRRLLLQAARRLRAARAAPRGPHRAPRGCLGGAVLPARC